MSASYQSFQTLLRDFYSLTTTNHCLYSSKQIQLDQLLNEFRETPICPSSPNCEENNSFMLETHSTDGESGSHSHSLSRTASFSENMFFTFLGMTQQNEHEEDHICSDQIEIQNNFANTTVFRLVAYAVVINHCQITQIHSKGDGSQKFHNSIQQIGHLAMQKLRKAMVTAAYSLKQGAERKEYLKVRYLCEHLFACLEKDLPNKSQYVRIIFQEFDSFYLKLVQQELFKARQRSYKPSKLIEETSFCQNLKEINQTSQDKFGQALRYMQIRLCIKQLTKMTSIGSRQERVTVVIESQKDKCYHLRQIVTLAKISSL